MKKKAMDEGCEKKERHIVMWTQEDDDILRKQISIHGTDNWTIIASKFKDKTTRQCRRRWYTYLNSDFKKGGWSPEEDMLLCEAQKIFGNKWTEIAKVVTGRTDNAVKNRFTTLCKKRAKHETLAKENNNITYVNPNNNRGLFSTNQALEAPSPIKRMRRTHISALSECSHSRTESTRECEANNQRRPPLAVLSQNLLKLGDISTQHLHKNAKGDLNAEAIGNKTPQATYLKKDDPKINALMQQAELLSSLAQKVNGENTDQSLESAWKVLQDFLSRTELNDVLKFKPPDMGFQHEELKDLIEDSRGSNEGSQPSWRQPDLHESPCGSEYSTTSTLAWQIAGDKSEQIKDETYALKDVEDGILAIHDAERNSEHECTNVIPSDVATGQETFSSCCEQKAHGRIVPASSCTEFGSPLQVTPLFRSLGTGIPSPKFSESERSFLMKAFGMESPSTNSSQPPPCKKALLHSL